MFVETNWMEKSLQKNVVIFHRCWIPYCWWWKGKYL